MDRRVPLLLGGAFAATVLLVGCAPAPADHPSTPATHAASAPATTPASKTDESGALTADAVAAVAPNWEGSRFAGFVGAPDGHAYGGDCRASAWAVLSLTERASRVARTFQAPGGAAPTPTLVVAVVPLETDERQTALDALTHQFTSCVGESPDGSVRQRPLTLDDWSGLHQVRDDLDLMWASYTQGVVVAQLAPGSDTTSAELVDEVRAILALQLAELRSPAPRLTAGRR
ncbi:hypothetical protein ROT00_04705 [Agromyces mediolanus]|uniref:hypothetical protein n=1 Tax=Agromyces mediolanus TaxID=41986 RepID=UPI00383710E7